jgi:hypothetical protein
MREWLQLTLIGNKREKWDLIGCQSRQDHLSQIIYQFNLNAQNCPLRNGPSSLCEWLNSHSGYS